MVPGGSLTVSRTEPLDGLACTSLPSRYAFATAMNVLEYSAAGVNMWRCVQPMLLKRDAASTRDPPSAGHLAAHQGAFTNSPTAHTQAEAAHRQPDPAHALPCYQLSGLFT